MADGTTINGDQYYGATININGYLGIGTGTLTVGGTLNVSAEGYIGYGASSNGVVKVTAGTWNVGTLLYIGYEGPGVLTISNGGIVSVLGGAATLGQNAGVSGTLNIGAAIGAAAGTAGTLDTASLVFGPGNGALNFNHTSTSYDFSSAMSGAGVITQAAGVTSLTGDSSGFGGTVEVSGGALLVDAALGASVVTVASGGSLGGTSTIAGAVTVDNGGILQGSPGSTLSMDSLSLDATSEIRVDLGAPSNIALFSVTSSFTLDGLLYVANAGGFAEGTYRLVDYSGRSQTTD